jgi:hypothetical protein
MNYQAYAFLAGYMDKEAGLKGIVKNVAKVTADAPSKASNKYQNVKRYLSRNPALSDKLPEGAKKIKKNMAGDTLSYIDPSSGYKHTKDAPSLLETVGKASVNSPRLFKNPKLDNISKRVYQGGMVGLAGKGAYDINEKRKQYDSNVQQEADKIRTHDETLADLTEQAKSGNVVSRLVGQNKYQIPKDHFLAPLNYLMDDANKSAAKEGLMAASHEAVGNKQKEIDKVKMLFKPPVTSSGVIGKSLSNVIGEPKSPARIGKDILKSSITPEADEKMSQTPNGRIILEILKKARDYPAEEAQEFIYKNIGQARSLWEQLKRRGKLTAEEIERRVKALINQ